MPPESATRPAVRRNWPRWLWLLPIGVVVIIAAVFIARTVLYSPDFAGFFRDFPGDTELPADAPVGFPAWLSWSHFLNSFFLIFIVRSGLQIRSTKRPPAFVTRTAGWINAARPPRRLSLHVWWHLVIDTLFTLNLAFYLVLVFASGQWVRIVPLGWDVIPNALSAGIQYVAFDWPTHNGWVHYNALQLLFYFATVFLAGPLALLTGLRLSPGWPVVWTRFNRLFSEALARRVHFWVLVYYIGFTAVHVFLVFATGAVRNLNHMYAARDDDAWIGAVVWAASFVVMVAAYFLLREPVQARIAQLGNTVKRMPPSRP